MKYIIKKINNTSNVLIYIEIESKKWEVFRILNWTFSRFPEIENRSLKLKSNIVHAL